MTTHANDLCGFIRSMVKNNDPNVYGVSPMPVGELRQISVSNDMTYKNRDGTIGFTAVDYSSGRGFEITVRSISLDDILVSEVDLF